MRAKSPLPLVSGILIGAAVFAGAFLYTQRPAISQTRVSDDSVVSVRMRFGVTDTAPKSWDGSLTVTGGEALQIRDWHPRPGDRIDGNHGWSLSSRKGINFVRRPWEEEATGGVVPYVNPVGIVVDLKAAAGTSIRVETKQGEFVLTPRILETGK